MVMSVRMPAVAGHFYPDSGSLCRSEVDGYLAQGRGRRQEPGDSTVAELRDALAAGAGRLVGGIVPHAGWICSGAVAAEVIGEVCRDRDIDTVVVFGAAHRFMSARAALWCEGAWATPLGEVLIDDQLANAVLAASDDVEANPEAHRVEHSIEVQVPFIQRACPAARLLPLLVPPPAPALAIGLAVAEQARLLDRRVIFLGSTDLTHYGPRYGFTPKGDGPQALTWAKEQNDRWLLDLVCQMEADRIVPEAHKHQNACGAGAVAATMAACSRAGATRGVILRHTTSAEVLQDRYGPMSDAVGYAGIVFSRPMV
jgi:MEMO1 family protein